MIVFAAVRDGKVREEALRDVRDRESWKGSEGWERGSEGWEGQRRGTEKCIDASLCIG